MFEERYFVEHCFIVLLIKNSFVSFSFLKNMIKNNAIAANQIFHVSQDFVQVTYWDNLIEHSSLKPMNL